MKTNISRDIDTQYGYDLEIETAFTREDGFMCAALLNGEQIDMFYGSTAEADAKQRLYSEVTHQINGGAKPQQEEQPMQEPTYAELVANREAAYIAQRDAENKLNEIKAALTASIAADTAYKNDQARKAELANRLQDYDIYVDSATKTADVYRAALAAIEVYQEQAKDQRAKMRYETALLEFKAAEISLQVAQARHDAAEPVDESPYGNVR